MSKRKKAQRERLGFTLTRALHDKPVVLAWGIKTGRLRGYYTDNVVVGVFLADPYRHLSMLGEDQLSEEERDAVRSLEKKMRFAIKSLERSFR